MKRAVLALPIAAVLAGVAWPAARGVDAEPGVCALLSAAKLLEHPTLAEQYAQALRAQDAEEIGRVAELLREIRSAHGCEGELSLPSAPRAAPRLPPGHPPVGRPSSGEGEHAPRPLFEAPGTVTI